MSEADTTRARQPLTRLLEVTAGEPLRRENLTIFPLIAEPQPELPYLLLGDALDLGLVSIGEVGSGSVPSLQAVNRGDLDVLILDGEQLIGAKQNRITNRTIILQAKTETVIPVSCMEQGRWHHVSEEFRSRPKPRHAPPRVRRKAREVESAYAAAPSMANAGVLYAAQGEVWREIADVGVSMGVRSDTGAMDEIYDRHTESVDDWIATFPCREDQVGLLAFLGRRPLGLDVVGGHAMYERLHDRFLGGYVMDALARTRRREGKAPGSQAASIAPDRASRFLSIVGASSRGRAPTVGKGTYHLIAGRAIGAELSDVVDSRERLAHLSAFPGHRSNRSGSGPVDTGGGRPTYGPIASPSRRRGWAGGSGRDDD
jgi:hypothetical protein